MGDGPGYDVMYDRLAREATNKLKAQAARKAMLYKMLMTVGFGDCDSNNSRIETEIFDNILRAYDLLGLVTRDGERGCG